MGKSPYDFVKSELVRAVAEGDAACVKDLVAKGRSLDVFDPMLGPPLNVAIVSQDHRMLKTLLELGANPNQVPSRYRGDTPLISAIVQGVPKIVKLLLEQGADVNAPDPHGQTPLMAAVSIGDIKICQLLIESGANVFQKNLHGVSPLTMVRDAGNRSLRQYIEQAAKQRSAHATLVDAARVGELQRVVELVTASSPEQRAVAAVAATQAGHALVLQHLLKSGVSPNTLRPAEYRDPPKPLLWIAVTNDDVATVDVLVAAGADVNMEIRFEEGARTTPLSAAVHRKLAIVKRLVEAGADLWHRDSQGHTALSQAKTAKRQVVVRYLEPRYTDQDRTANLSLTDSARDGSIQAIEACLQAGHDIDGRDRRGDTPLVVAAEMGHVDFVRHLLDAGADASKTTAQGRTAWEAAAASAAAPELVAMLLERVQPTYRLLGLKATAEDQVHLWEAPLGSEKAPELIPLLLQAGIDVNGQMQDGYTPLLFAVLVGGKRVDEVLKQLLQAGADPHATLIREGSVLPKSLLTSLASVGIAPRQKTPRIRFETALDLARRSNKKAYNFLRNHLHASADAYDLAEEAIHKFKTDSQSPHFVELVKSIGKQLRTTPKPWKKRATVAQFSCRLTKVFSLPADAPPDVQIDALETLREQAREREATLVYRGLPDDSRNLTQLLLFPTTSWSAIMRACGTNGNNLGRSGRDVVNWFAACELRNAFELIGCGFDFAHVRFASPIVDADDLLRDIQEFCPDVGADEPIDPCEFAQHRECYLWWD